MKAVITDCTGTTLSAEEKDLFSEQQPYGYILFQRHCESSDQVKALIDTYYELTDRKWLPILIDQEGGRVQRLKPPIWRKYPPASTFADLFQTDPQKATRACYLNSYVLGRELKSLGITVDCAPLADIPVKGSHDVIGDRAFGDHAESVIALARVQAYGLLAAGILPVLKHIPGHGRASVDSHESLPTVETDLATLRSTDFEPFRALNTLPYGMTAHITYEAIDPKQPATLSRDVISLIREEIGFTGILMSDDISMKALSGSLTDITQGCIEAGCDVALHCNGSFEAREEVLMAAPEVSESVIAQTASFIHLIQQHRKTPLDEKHALDELASLGLQYEAEAV